MFFMTPMTNNTCKSHEYPMDSTHIHTRTHTQTHTHAGVLTRMCKNKRNDRNAMLCMVNINMYANKIIILAQNSLNEAPQGGRGTGNREPGTGNGERGLPVRERLIRWKLKEETHTQSLSQSHRHSHSLDRENATAN